MERRRSLVKARSRTSPSICGLYLGSAPAAVVSASAPGARHRPKATPRLSRRAPPPPSLPPRPAEPPGARLRPAPAEIAA
jgi:hypothetical protein